MTERPTRRRQSKDPPKPAAPPPQYALDFDSVIRNAEVRSRDQVTAASDPDVAVSDYNPVAQTAEYMRRSLKVEDAWEGTISRAREALLKTDARELYLEFLVDVSQQINNGVSKAPRLVELLRAVGIRGLGLSPDAIRIEDPQRGGTRYRTTVDRSVVEGHLASHVVGKFFLNEMRPDDSRWRERSPVIGGSDVSQHTSAVPVPARFFRRSVPFVLNNAAGALFRVEGKTARYDNVFNPRPDEALLRWMLIDPSYSDELEPEDYRRVLGSAMDVGQYKFDRDYLLKNDRRSPDVILRDGSLFPQDAYLDNFAIENRRGDFTREAIRELLDCLLFASAMPTIYCGIAKSVQLKVYSAAVDWFIGKRIDSSWELGNYTLNDGQSMSILLSSPDFVSTKLDRVVATCLVRRSFTTRANLNVRVPNGDHQRYFADFQRSHQAFDITPFRRLCELAHVYMFFMGHSKSPQQQIPRYEFFYHSQMGTPESVGDAVLAALRECSIMDDQDHSFMSDDPITYLIPSVTQQAHLLSKDVGKHIDQMTGQWIMARYRDLVTKGS
ncbi:MAG TPA: hypothetical protein VIF83_00050 [Gemmatimonadaceae bacterium]